MDWTQLLVFMATMGGLFFWVRSEAREDNRAIMALISSIKDEIKDFHGRLCILEERYLKGRKD